MVSVVVRTARPRAASSLALALACALPGLASAQSTLKLGERVSGEITSASRINYNDGSRSSLFNLALGKDDAVALRTEGALCARLSVFDQGQVLADSSRNSPSCEDDAPQAQLSFRAPAAGTYQVAVSGAHARAYGPFRLSAESIQAYRGGPLRPGAEVSDLLRPDGNTYTLEVAELGQYVIDMRSGEFDSVLSLTGPGVEIEDDDGGNRLDARLRTLLEPGSYTLTARGLDEASGGFTLGIAFQPLPEGTVLRNSGALELGGASVSGAVAGEPREYSLVLDQRRQVTVDLASSHFDTLLEIVGEQTRLRDDDGGEKTNSRIVTVLDPGSYKVLAGSTGASSGLFTLSAKAGDAPAGTQAVVNVGGSTSGTLVPGGKDRYVLTVARAGTYRFDAIAPDMDVILDLVRAGEQVVTDDDGGGATNARIEVALEAGRYELIVHAWGGNTGRYELKAARLR
jgi:hypothetical protein